MELAFSFQDFLALSPLWSLLLGSMILLLLQSFDQFRARKYSQGITLATLLLSLGFTVWAPASTNPLLTDWLQFDALATFFLVFFLLVGLSIVLISSPLLQRSELTHGEYGFFLLTSIIGLMFIALSADFLILFLGIETLSISLYIWCGYVKQWTRSRESSIKYFLMGSIAAGFLLYGIALIYGAVGTTRFDALLQGYQQAYFSSQRLLFLGGISLVTLALLFEAAVVPFQLWAPDVYEGSATPVTAFMAIATKAGAFAAIIRLFFQSLQGFDPLWNEVVAWFVYPTLIYAGFVACKQTQLRRFFAYSGISQAGFLLIAVVVGTPASLTALLFYLVIYAFATIGCFAAIGCLKETDEGAKIEDLHGFFKRAPFSAALLSICLLTLAGLPPTIGFFAKFYLFQLAFEAGYYAIVIVGLLAALLGVYYYLRIIGVMLKGIVDSSEKHLYPFEEQNNHSKAGLFVVGCVVIVAIVTLTFSPSYLVESLASLKL